MKMVYAEGSMELRNVCSQCVHPYMKHNHSPMMVDAHLPHDTTCILVHVEVHENLCLVRFLG
jgi:hypothetical protein